ncbi:hypothetical protein EZV62_006398 [Acer yangbiense]|uniref:TF-B3 domain-containing protein n=1 Tax=Acer yangbiense TaxID=1000413 RepID=A0A5C7I6F8_9ROSI|nr:hypothetical protein EZV62_006398 [Acer yangbiense]
MVEPDQTFTSPRSAAAANQIGVVVISPLVSSRSRLHTMALSNFEISKTLTESDITENKVELPVNIVEHMEPLMMNGEHSVDLKAVDRWKQQWSVRYYTRPNNVRKTAFTSGWRKLVEANGVLPGDELIFSRRQDAGEMQYYMIQVKRRTNTREGETVQGEPVIYW